MNWVAIPAAIALVIKCYLILSKKKLASENSAWYYFVFVFAINNFAELLILSSQDILSSEMIVRAYHPTAIAVLFYCMIYAIGSEKTKLDRALIYVAGACSAFLSIAIMLTDLVLLGGKPFGYYITAIRGEHYYLFQSFVLGMCFLIASILLRNLISSDSEKKKNQTWWLIAGLAPSLIITATSVTLMALGFKINALILTPIGSTLFLFITLYAYHNDYRKLNLKGVFKFSPSIESILHEDIIQIEKEFLNDGISLPEASDRFQKALLSYISKEESGNISKIAVRAGIGRSTLYQKGVRLGYNWKNDRAM